jgi:AcrR family transcriptional regulator
MTSSDPARKPYRLRARQERMDRTRAAIVAAARDLISTRGPAAMTLDAVATASGTTRQTLYNLVGSRGALLLAVAQDSQQRSGFDRLVAEFARPDAIDAMRGALREGVRIYAEEAHVIRGVYAAAVDHPDLRAALGEIEHRRQLGQRATVARLAAQGLLAEGWTAADAEDALMVTTSFTAYDLLRGLGRPTDDIAAVLIGLCDAILLPHRRRTPNAP